MNNNTIEVNGRKFEIKEMSIGEALPIIGKLSGDGAAEAQIDMLNACVTESGNAIVAAELPFSYFTPLIGEAMKVNGFGGDGDEGNE